MPTEKVPHEAPQSDETQGNKIRVVSRAIDVLTALSNHPDGLSLREIAHYVKLPRSTVQRIVETLEDANVVIAATTTSGYRLGPTMALFAASMRPFDLSKIARPIVMQLSKKTHENVDLSVLAHGKAVIVDQIPGSHPLKFVGTLGTSLPLHATASGKALLASLPGKELEALRPSLELNRLTRNTITTWDGLMEELRSIRTTGLALEREEYLVGFSGIAAPLVGPNGERGALGIPMPTERFQPNEKKLIKDLLSCCQPLHWKA
ncbi:IclR family transcriptional regulator [Holophaga foetida]|uniref:IclR family transcriptional regulator n=1 Tax=Holophaga foetida TaxID=35839 RepID=UPI0002475367|nr:IclR family transcriptional regulator [Holophaga foetida]